MAIIKQYRPDIHATYVYESHSYWDKEKQQPRAKRKLLGRLDPETGEIVPTGRRGPKPKKPEDTSTTEAAKAAASEKAESTADLKQKVEHEFAALQTENKRLAKENQQLHSEVDRLNGVITGIMTSCKEAIGDRQ